MLSGYGVKYLGGRSPGLPGDSSHILELGFGPFAAAW
jgi:hypothetical protein